MPVTIEDTTPAFLAFWAQAENRSPAEQVALWHNDYEHPHRALFAASGDRHGGADQLPPALVRFPAAAARIRRHAPLLRTAIERVSPGLARRFDAEGMDLRWVLLVGLFWSDGWFTVVDGVPTCFLAVELLDDIRLAEVSIAHEAAHALHHGCAPGGLDDLSQLGDRLFVEGLAVLASAEVVPGLSEGHYLWPGRSETIDGEDVAAWVSACQAWWPDLRVRLLAALSSTDMAVGAPYLFVRDVADSLPARAGYFAGARLVAALAQSHPLAELARWPAARIRREMATALHGAETCPPPALTSGQGDPTGRRG